MHIPSFRFCFSPHASVFSHFSLHETRTEDSRGAAAKPPGRAFSCLPGSFTVESALLVPLILGVLFLMLYASSHVHARTVYTGAACERAVTGSEFTPYVFLSHELSLSQSDSENERSVKSSVTTQSPVGPRTFSADAMETYKKMKPVKFIRRARAAGELMGAGS